MRIMPHAAQLPMAVTAVAMWAAATTTGCGWNDDSASAPSTRPRGIAPVANSEQQRPAARPAPATRPAPEKKKLAPFDWDAYKADDNPTPAPEPEQEPEEERDYGAELQAAVGSPASCLKPRAGDDAPSRIDVVLSAVVVETGRVTRGTASSALLDRAELDCITQRVKSAHIPANVEGSPRNITTTVSLELARSAPKPAENAP